MRTPAKNETEPLVAGLAVAGARSVLSSNAPEWQDDDAEVALQRAIEGVLQRAPDLCELSAAEAEVDGMDERDARAVVLLRGIAKESSEELRKQALDVAAQWESAARKHWADHVTRQQGLPGLTGDWERWSELEQWRLRLANGIGHALWEGSVRALVERERERDQRSLPGFATPVAAQIQASFWASAALAQKTTQDGSASLELVGPDGDVLARTPTLRADQLEVVQRGTTTLGLYSGHVMVRRLAEEGHRRTRALLPSPSILAWEGGISTFREWLGLKGRRAETELSAALQAGQLFQHERKGLEVGGLWTYLLNRAAPGKRAYLEVRLGAPLMPYYSAKLDPADRFVVPIVPMPPRVGRDNEWAKQAAFQFAIVRALVDHRVDLVRNNGALLPEAEMLRLAAAVGLPARTVAKVLDRWTQDGTDGERCLELVEKDRYHLPDNAPYHAAREFLNGGGARSLRRSKAGQASARKRGKL